MARTLTAAALIIALALSPSISECLKAHEEGDPKARLMWAWVALVILLALIFGEEMLGNAG